MEKLIMELLFWPLGRPQKKSKIQDFVAFSILPPYHKKDILIRDIFDFVSASTHLIIFYFIFIQDLHNFYTYLGSFN